MAQADNVWGADRVIVARARQADGAQRLAAVHRSSRRARQREPSLHAVRRAVPRQGARGRRRHRRDRRCRGPRHHGDHHQRSRHERRRPSRQRRGHHAPDAAGAQRCRRGAPTASSTRGRPMSRRPSPRCSGFPIPAPSEGAGARRRARDRSGHCERAALSANLHQQSATRTAYAAAHGISPTRARRDARGAAPAR